MNSFGSKAHARIAQFGVDNQKRLHDLIRDTVWLERRRINTEVKTGTVTDADQLEAMRDDLVMLGEMNNTADQLAFVGLYSLVELRVKALLKDHIVALVTSNAITSRDAKQVYRIDVLKQVLRDHLRIDLPLVNHYAAIDEIRLINNSVKHNGVVSADLAGYPGWRRGRPLRGLPRAFNRLSPQVAPFFEDLAKKTPNLRPRTRTNPTLP